LISGVFLLGGQRRPPHRLDFSVGAGLRARHRSLDCHFAEVSIWFKKAKLFMTLGIKSPVRFCGERARDNKNKGEKGKRKKR
jgi:hypothetical protein